MILAFCSAVYAAGIAATAFIVATLNLKNGTFQDRDSKFEAIIFPTIWPLVALYGIPIWIAIKLHVRKEKRNAERTH